MMKNTIKVVVKEPGHRPEPREIPNTLEELQGFVGGYIEVYDLAADLAGRAGKGVPPAPGREADRGGDGEMKKAFVFLAALALLLLCGCGYGYSEADTEQEQTSPVLEVFYGSDFAGWIIIRDTRTGVQYLRAPNGGVCMMVNPDGTPYTGEAD